MTPGKRQPGTAHTWQWWSKNDYSHSATLCCQTGRHSHLESADAAFAPPPCGLDLPRPEFLSRTDRDLRKQPTSRSAHRTSLVHQSCFTSTEVTKDSSIWLQTADTTYSNQVNQNIFANIFTLMCKKVSGDADVITREILCRDCSDWDTSANQNNVNNITTDNPCATLSCWQWLRRLTLPGQYLALIVAENYSSLVGTERAPGQTTPVLQSPDCTLSHLMAEHIWTTFLQCIHRIIHIHCIICSCKLSRV